jgi:hypothetical protein
MSSYVQLNGRSHWESRVLGQGYPHFRIYLNKPQNPKTGVWGMCYSRITPKQPWNSFLRLFNLLTINLAILGKFYYSQTFTKSQVAVCSLDPGQYIHSVSHTALTSWSAHVPENCSDVQKWHGLHVKRWLSQTRYFTKWCPLPSNQLLQI